MTDRGKAYSVLTMNTLAFTICFAVWMMNGVLITYLVDNGVYLFSKVEMGWLIGIPVLTGAIFRLPVGVLTDKYGGRPVYAIIMLITAVAAFLTSYADGFWELFLGGLGFGLAGTSFAVGIAYSSVWFPSHQQGTALGIFGAGNAGAAITSMGAPMLLGIFTNQGEHIDGWRMLPKTFAIALLVMTIVFWIFTYPRKVQTGKDRTLTQRLAPLKLMRVWRFGLYYFLVFGGFVALSQWLIPYYVNVYAVSIATAGLLASIFTLPSGVIRAAGGWLSDKFGARSVMYWVLIGCGVGSLLLIIPRMDIYAPGQGVMAVYSGTVTSVDDNRIVVGETAYPLITQTEEISNDEEMRVFPTGSYRQEAIVAPGDQVRRKSLLARGVTHISFQANIWIFTAIVFVIGILMGIGKAAVYKHIPTYFPDDVGVVGGIVGVLGGLGGFVCPILFGYMLSGSGIWTTSWVFFMALSVACLVWMHAVIRKMEAAQAPDLAQHIEDSEVLQSQGVE
jgi:MFS transporter, NNP family, nitrate/nitrite transporter